MNKSKIISTGLFVVAFIATYLFLCFGVSGLRIKLDAEPIEYFFASIKHMVLFKFLISIAVVSIIGILPIIIRDRKQK